MYDRYIQPLQTALLAQADAKTKSWWEGYVKDSAPFLGVKMAAVRAAVHRWHGELVAGDLDPSQQVDLALALFAEAHTEEKLAGTLFLQEILLPAGALRCSRDLERLAGLFTAGWIYDWNICDWFCVKVLGPLIEKEGAACAVAVAAWRDAENLWQARASLVAFVPLAAERDYDSLIEPACRVLIRRPERFAKTAVGWILREISRHDPGFMERVVAENVAHFTTESLKNATKYAEKATQQRFRTMMRRAQTSSAR